MASSTTMLSLPNELLGQIVEGIESVKDVRSLALTCKRFSGFCQERLISTAAVQLKMIGRLVEILYRAPDLAKWLTCLHLICYDTPEDMQKYLVPIAKRKLEAAIESIMWAPNAKFDLDVWNAAFQFDSAAEMMALLLLCVPDLNEVSFSVRQPWKVPFLGDLVTVTTDPPYKALASEIIPQNIEIYDHGVCADSPPMPRDPRWELCFANFKAIKHFSISADVFGSYVYRPFTHWGGRIDYDGLFPASIETLRFHECDEYVVEDYLEDIPFSQVRLPHLKVISLCVKFLPETARRYALVASLNPDVVEMSHHLKHLDIQLWV
ncbi:hypothetical protein BDV96DRAFT_652753 [Lophiotrema nucula]|uniref:F-box domain-containing protein n=1 Tax=Lophiotrema nucula TaxID=690887 RepID=A0A6A5YP43_9PLEO|nr:hypothetical protein BDV96DRAFT_652753 [Lophiotrema nucula]